MAYHGNHRMPLAELLAMTDEESGHSPRFTVASANPLDMGLLGRIWIIRNPAYLANPPRALARNALSAIICTGKERVWNTCRYSARQTSSLVVDTTGMATVHRVSAHTTISRYSKPLQYRPREPIACGQYGSYEKGEAAQL